MNYKPYKHLPPFKGMVLQNFPFIEEDFDAITNYQLLCKIEEYLKNVVANELVLEENVTNLYNSFVELKNYVDNYFANLDVQEEINNKLDEMTEDGTLQEIIGDYLNANALWCFDTIEDMKSSTNLIDGSFARTLGYYTINDGGSALYKIRQITNEDIVDNMFIIPMEDESLIAELIIENGTVNIKQIGAKGDGTTDDYTHIQTAINTGKNIYFPPGNYLISNTLTINGRNNWNFDSSEATITYSGIDYAIEFRTIRNSNLYIGVIRATNGGCISFIGDSSSQYSQYVNIDFNTFISKTNCIYVENKTNCWISEFRINKGRFQSGNNGLYMLQNASAGISHWVFNNIGIEGVDVGFNFNVGEYAEANNHYIDSCEFNECRSGEAQIVLKNDGIIRKFLWLSSHYVTQKQIDVTNECTDIKFIHSERTNYIYNGVWSERSINVTDNITPGTGITLSGGKVRMTDDLAIVNINIKGTEEDISLTQNQLILSGLPKPDEPIYVIGQNYGDNTQMQPRFVVNTSGELRAYWPGSAKIPTGNYSTYINLAYFKHSMNP